MSYIERAFWSWLKNQIIGGYRTLKKKEYLLFTLVLISIMTFNTMLAVVYELNLFPSLPITLDFVQYMLIMELMLSFAVIICGLVLGRMKKIGVPYYIISILVISSVILIYFIFNSLFSYSDNIIFPYVEIIYLIAWVCISTISLFFMILYFLTSFPKKILMLGIPKDHIFFGSILKIGSLGLLIVYLNFLLQSDLSSIIIGVFGLITSIFILLVLFRAPKHVALTEKEITKREKRKIEEDLGDEIEKEEKKRIIEQKIDISMINKRFEKGKAKEIPGIINFATAIGFFNLYLAYHLFSSSSSSSNLSITTMVIDLFLILINSLYIIQSQTKGVLKAKEKPGLFHNQVTFQSRLHFTANIKKIFGEKGVVLILLGIILGYHVVYLDSFFDRELPFLSYFMSSNLKMSAIYHRFCLILACGMLIILILYFITSSKFQDFMTDKFTINQVFKYIGGFFTRSGEGIPSVVEQKIDEVEQKIEQKIEEVRDNVSKGAIEIGKKIGAGIAGLSAKFKAGLNEQSEKADNLEKSKKNSEDDS
ncbi:MAG: hypothetical protein GY870_17990 [archaeon]|nr:hypothetical protein [archaeon]